MKLYVTYGSPYARLARIIVIEKALEDRVEIIAAKTRRACSLIGIATIGAFLTVGLTVLFPRLMRRRH
jgi:hypothetical protein